MCCKLKNEHVSCPNFKTQIKLWKPNHSFNDSKRRRMILSCRRKDTCIIERNNVKTCWRFLWLGLTLKHVGDFYGLNCLPSFITKRQTLTS